MPRLLLAAAIALLATHMTVRAAAPGKIIKAPGGQQMVGNISWKGGAKQYEVSTGAGVMTIVPLNQVGSIEVAPPANLAAAVAAARAGDGSQTAALTQIVDSYLMLGPDLTAMRWLAELQLKRGEGKQALEKFTRVMENRQPGSVPAEVVRSYWGVLLDAGKTSELREQLKSAIEKAPRPQAAAAQMMRGEVDMRDAKYRDALVDGFLRTIVLFGDVKEVQPEALFKAAKCFDELGESQNAEKMRRRLSQDYPDSPFAK